jgi:hypothetical protein
LLKQWLTPLRRHRLAISIRAVRQIVIQYAGRDATMPNFQMNEKMPRAALRPPAGPSRSGCVKVRAWLLQNKSLAGRNSGPDRLTALQRG